MLKLPERLLLGVYGGWTLWCYLEARTLLPVTDEARSRLWAPSIYGSLQTIFTDLPPELDACARDLAHFLYSLEARGDSCEDAEDSLPTDTLRSNTLFPSDASSLMFEMGRFPWDET